MASPAFPDARAYSVSQLNGYIREMFDFDALMNGLFVAGEVSNFKAHPSGHWYFTLRDERAAMRAVMFREEAGRAGFMPEDGQKVILYGAISVYEKTGQYQLYAEMMQPLGMGAMQAAYEQLKRKLSAEGLFDAARKRPLPASPRCVALATSLTGAAVRDMINVIRRRDAAVRLVVAPCAVQGVNAANEIAAAIGLVNEWGGADIIIVGRGGGAAEDLAAFNDEAVARAVAGSAIPVISAVGHETDVTLSDFAADLRAPTPSAAAELAVPERAAADKALTRLASRLERAVCVYMDKRRGTVIGYTDALDDAARRSLRDAGSRLARAADGLEKVSPLKVLRRGYGVVTKGGERVSSVRQLAVGDTAGLAFADGRAAIDIKEIVYGEEGGQADTL